MMLFKSVYTDVSNEPSLVSCAVKEGLRELGYESIKPEQATAVESLLKGQDIFSWTI